MSMTRRNLIVGVAASAVALSPLPTMAAARAEPHEIVNRLFIASLALGEILGNPPTE
jgi:hypothetical protein